MTEAGSAVGEAVALVAGQGLGGHSDWPESGLLRERLGLEAKGCQPFLGSGTRHASTPMAKAFPLTLLGHVPPALPLLWSSFPPGTLSSCTGPGAKGSK